MTQGEIESQTLHVLSHPGTPGVLRLTALPNREGPSSPSTSDQWRPFYVLDQQILSLWLTVYGLLK